MSEIEIFHYYRQDVLNRRYSGMRFFRKGRNNKAVVNIDRVLKNVRMFVEDCRKDYDILEEYSVVRSERGMARKEYQLCILGEGGEIGFFFGISTPISNPVGANMRASPGRFSNRRGYKQRG